MIGTGATPVRNTDGTGDQARPNPAPNCLHCRSTRIKVLLRYRDQRTFRCRDCGGHFNRPEHDADRVYTSSYFEKVYAPRKTAQLEQGRRYLRIIRQHAKEPSILDYGCGSGVFLLAAREAGLADVAGADISPHALASARRNLNDRVALIDLASDALPARRFGLIALLDTLSALPDARTVLEHLRDHHLAEGGLVAIRTPHLPRSYFLLVRALAPVIGKKQASRFLFAENRYALFDVDSLRRLLALLGFEPIVVEFSQDYPLPKTPNANWLDPVWAVLRRILQRPIIFILAKGQTDGSAAEEPEGPQPSR